VLEEGAVVKLGGRFFVIVVSTGKFICDGYEIMGISTQAPIYAELEGKRAGDAISFNGREFVIEEVADSCDTEGRKRRLGITHGDRPESCGAPRKEASDGWRGPGNLPKPPLTSTARR
jgi:hypothetical protein